jgi:hypothetical protein
MTDKADIEDKRISKIADKIKQLRISAKFSSAESFAYEHELNRVQYWRVESGSNITLKTLLKVLDIHKITLEEFFKKL